MTTPGLPPKKDVMLALLERSSVFIHLDPRHADARVPAWFKKQPQLVLQVGLNLAVRIPDLDIGDDAVSCTLSFNRSPFFCYIPWAAIFGLVGDDGRAMLWPTDIPPEVAAQQAERAQKEKARERIRSVETGGSKDAPPPEPAQISKGAKTSKPERVPTASGSTPGSGSGKPSKKREPARLRPEKAPSDEPARTGGEREQRRQTPAGESKRPLPPYLRVVK